MSVELNSAQGTTASFAQMADTKTQGVLYYYGFNIPKAQDLLSIAKEKHMARTVVFGQDVENAMQRAIRVCLDICLKNGHVNPKYAQSLLNLSSMSMSDSMGLKKSMAIKLMIPSVGQDQKVDFFDPILSQETRAGIRSEIASLSSDEMAELKRVASAIDQMTEHLKKNKDAILACTEVKELGANVQDAFLGNPNRSQWQDPSMNNIKTILKTLFMCESKNVSDVCYMLVGLPKWIKDANESASKGVSVQQPTLGDLIKIGQSVFRWISKIKIATYGCSSDTVTTLALMAILDEGENIADAVSIINEKSPDQAWLAKTIGNCADNLLANVGSTIDQVRQSSRLNISKHINDFEADDLWSMIVLMATDPMRRTEYVIMMPPADGKKATPDDIQRVRSTISDMFTADLNIKFVADQDSRNGDKVVALVNKINESISV